MVTQVPVVVASVLVDGVVEVVPVVQALADHHQQQVDLVEMDNHFQHFRHQ
tara:strand:+ start:512 stop:664 length:153 start_codon:yes stop_codon:yes gene_type:complete